MTESPPRISTQTEMKAIKATTYVFGPLIRELADVGYTEKNLRAMPYDWRLPPHKLQERDQYFTYVCLSALFLGLACLCLLVTVRETAARLGFVGAVLGGGGIECVA